MTTDLTSASSDDFDPRPFSHPVRFDEAAFGRSIELSADDTARQAIAQILDLEAVKSLTAKFTTRAVGNDVAVEGHVLATVTQVCGVTLEAFDETVEGEIELVCTLTEPDYKTSAHDQELSLEEIDEPDFIEDGVIDLGAYALEALALSLDPFPRKPGVEFVQPEEPVEISPFSALKGINSKDSKE